jgi:hypothetical protein
MTQRDKPFVQNEEIIGNRSIAKGLQTVEGFGEDGTGMRDQNWQDSIYSELRNEKTRVIRP